MRISENETNQTAMALPAQKGIQPSVGRLASFPRKTRYRGIEEIEKGVYRIRVKAIDPRTGKPREIDRMKECSERDAVIHQAEWRRELVETFQQPIERIRLKDFANSWLTGKFATLLPPSRERYTFVVGRHIVPALGDFYLDALTHELIVEWRDKKRAEGYRANTINPWLVLLRQIMADATARYRLPIDPAARVDALPVDDARTTEDDPNSLTEEETKQFLDAIQERWPDRFPLVFTLFSTGARISQVCALKWEDIDFERKAISFRRRRWMDRVYEGQKSPRPTARQRVHRVALVKELEDILKAHRKDLVARQHRGLKDGWVFPSTGGAPHPNSILKKPFADVLAFLGWSKRFTPHGLRRTSNNLTRLAAGSVVAKSVLGHVTDEMHEHYSTVGIDEKRAAMEKVVRMVRKSGDRGGDRRRKWGSSKKRVR